MSITVNTKQATELLVDCLKARLVPMLTGSPGIGKSSIVYDIANEYNLDVIDMRLSQCDPTDLLGFPRVDGDKASYAPMNTFPLESDSLPEGKSGWLLFLDEFNSAPMAVQAAAYKLTLDRMVGLHKLHPNVVVMCAGNLQTDNAIVNRLSTAMQSRLVHLELSTDFEAWLEWAHANHIDTRITSYIEFKPNNLYQFSPEHNDRTFACPRTWEFVSKLISNWKEIDKSKLALIAGTVSEGVAREFIAFCREFEQLPKISSIIANPKDAPVPSEPSTRYAVAGAVGAHMNTDNAAKLMEYVDRLPPEFQHITLRGAIKRTPALFSHDAVSKWIDEKAVEFFA
jgi:hypothetical protein